MRKNLRLNLGTIRRAYCISESLSYILHVLVREVSDDKEESGKRQIIFYPSNGWSSLREHERLVFLPGEVTRTDWWDGWWEQNWKNCPDWAWCYGMVKGGYVGKYKNSKKKKTVSDIMRLAEVQPWGKEKYDPSRRSS